MKTKILILCLSFAGTVLGADFKEGYISYNITSPTTVSVAEVAIGSYSEYGGYTMRDTTRFEVPEAVEFKGHRMTVTAIGREAFNLSRIDTIRLPHTITEIGDYAFQNCPIKSINLPEGIHTIGNGAFYGCKLNEITLPKGLKNIGWQAFSLCPFKEIRFPKGLTSIGREAFSNCKNLTKLDLPDSLKTIGNGAFSWCENITQITTHGDIREIAYDSFNGCKRLTAIHWGGKVESLGGFAYCSSLTTFTVPEGTKTIYSSAFKGCTALKEVVLPKSVGEMGQAVFANCTSLKEVVLPSGLKTVTLWMFQNCSSLETLTIGENIANISSEAFEGCKNLRLLIVRGRQPANYSSSSYSQDMVDLFNNVELRVPTGSKDIYGNYAFWKNFRNVTEYDPGTLYQAVMLTIKEGGSVSCNGEIASEGESVLLVPDGQPFTLTFLPDDDHQVREVEQRYEGGIDYMKQQIKDNQLTIRDIKSQANFWVFFEAAKVNLDILQNEMGCVRLSVSKNRRYGFRIIEEEGWQVNSITFNGEVITDKGGKDNYIQTPLLKGDGVIRIAFEQIQTGLRDIEQDGIRVFGENEGIRIEQAQPGERINVYRVDGQLVKTVTCYGDSQRIALSPGTVYLISTRTKTIKIRL